MRFLYFFMYFVLLFTCRRAFSQQADTDSVVTLSEITVRAFEQHKNHSASTAVVKVIHAPVPFQNKTSLVQAFNTVPGVRMEERSPGSYRINIRGSSLRSPFGVRNVKVYWNDIPFTDPGGNTYFNQFAYNNFSYIQIFKGPASSMYGPGTGGLVLIGNELQHHRTEAEYVAGNYNYHTIMAKALWGNTPASKSMVSFAHSTGDGYRNHTAMRRDNVSWTTQFNINPKQTLMAAVLYTDMFYQTPGGLTLKEFLEEPRASRPAVGRLPSATDAKAAIWQKTFTTGIVHQNMITNTLTHKTTAYAAYAQVKNAAVRNVERRSEPHFGGRSIISYQKNFGHSHKNILKWDNGIEFQQGYFNIQVANNKAGSPDTLQTSDDIGAMVYSFISQVNADINDKWALTAGTSVNRTSLRFTRLNVYPVAQQRFTFNNEFAPRIAVLKRFQSNWFVLGSVSKGFSPPTIAELLPSTGIITPLQAEHGWNYELVIRKRIQPLQLEVEVSSYIFKLTDALVQRRDESGADYFVNAGKINQKGVEAYIGQTFIPGNGGAITYFIHKLHYTFNHFRYKEFVKASESFTGNMVPGIPQHSVSYMADISTKKGWYANASYYAASKIFMNDANTETTAPYFLLGSRMGYRKNIAKKIIVNIYTGADNLLNQVYSLGNDINAAAGRYYNAAPRRNYYAGIIIQMMGPMHN